MQNIFPGYVFAIKKIKNYLAFLQIFLLTHLLSIQTRSQDQKQNVNKVLAFLLTLWLFSSDFVDSFCVFLLLWQSSCILQRTAVIASQSVCCVTTPLIKKCCYRQVSLQVATIFSRGKKLDNLTIFVGVGGISTKLTPALNVCQLCWIVLKMANHKIPSFVEVNAP